MMDHELDKVESRGLRRPARSVFTLGVAAAIALAGCTTYHVAVPDGHGSTYLTYTTRYLPFWPFYSSGVYRCTDHSDRLQCVDLHVEEVRVDAEGRVVEEGRVDAEVRVDADGDGPRWGREEEPKLAAPKRGAAIPRPEAVRSVSPPESEKQRLYCSERCLQFAMAIGSVPDRKSLIVGCAPQCQTEGSEFRKCVAAAGSDTEALRACARLLPVLP